MLALDWYVDVASPGPTHDGSSWENAYADLQLALAAATAGDRILVADGTYTPTATADRSVSFVLKNGVSLLGGYAGYGATSPDARDVTLFLTVLSGDIGIVGDSSDNSYHVLVGGGTDATAVLDGFTITAGNADGSSPDDCGGGMWNSYSAPTLSNNTFSGNYAASEGGGISNSNSTPTLVNCIFSRNYAVYGGGMFNRVSSPTLDNSTFSENSAGNAGGMFNWYSSPTLRNSTFKWNTVYDSYRLGGGMCNVWSSPTLINTSFNGNSAYEGGGMWNHYSYRTSR